MRLIVFLLVILKLKCSNQGYVIPFQNIPELVKMLKYILAIGQTFLNTTLKSGFGCAPTEPIEEYISRNGILKN